MSINVMLNGESKPLQPAHMEVLSSTQVRLEISEGRYHQVKRMLAAVGNKVEKLHRQQIGALELADLEQGQWVYLTAAQVELAKTRMTI